MGPGMFDGLAEAAFLFVVIVAIACFALGGAATIAFQRFSHYHIRIERSHDH